jgi:hypothetical protein
VSVGAGLARIVRDDPSEPALLGQWSGCARTLGVVAPAQQAGSGDEDRATDEAVHVVSEEATMVAGPGSEVPQAKETQDQIGLSETTLEKGRHERRGARKIEVIADEKRGALVAI